MTHDLHALRLPAESLPRTPTRRGLVRLLLIAAALYGPMGAAPAAPPAPDILVRDLGTQVIDAVRADPAIQAGDVGRVSQLVEARVMPHVDARRMTASAVGRYWRQASDAQRQRLQQEFTQLVVRTYAGALSQVRDQSIVVRPLRAAPDATRVVVRTEVRGGGNPIQLDYRLARSPAGWKIYDVNVLGVWLTQNYRNSFASEIGRVGIDGLIETLAQKNRAGGR